MEVELLYSAAFLSQDKHFYMEQQEREAISNHKQPSVCCTRVLSTCRKCSGVCQLKVFEKHLERSGFTPIYMPDVCVSSGILFLAGAAPKYLCTYYDIVDYLNISSHNKLHTYILPKINLKEPVEVKMDFMLVAILSVVSTQNESLQQETGLLLGQGLI